MSSNIEGKVVVITGASSGLGEATARHLAGEGAKLVLGARRLDRLQALTRELNLGTDAAVATDVTDHAQVKRLVDAAVAIHGRIDVIINNAGLMPHSPLERGKVDDWDRMIDVNLKGVLYGIAAALPHMTRQKSGHIINVSSVAGHKVRPGSAVYAATKAAVRMLSEGLRQTPAITRGAADRHALLKDEAGTGMVGFTHFGGAHTGERTPEAHPVAKLRKERRALPSK